MKIKKEDIFFIIFCMTTAMIFAFYRCINGDFAAYNGDFQNYNIFRRLLAGQVQYRDFTNYLGTGIVLMNLPLVWLFNSFGACVFITHFTTSILYSFILCISFYTILLDRKKAYVIAGITAIAAFVILHAGFYGRFYFQYVYDVLNFEEQGVSMRTTRAFLPFMLVGLFYFVKNRTKCKSLFKYVFNSNRWIMIVYFVLGMLTVWSNDYGYSCVLCFFMIMAIVNIFGEPTKLIRRIIRCCITILSTITGMGLCVTIITHGSIKDYLTVNKGIVEDQFWYFGNYYGKYYTLSDIFSDKEYMVLTVLFFFHSFWFLSCAIRKKITDDNICRLFLHSVCYGASMIYVLGSGAHSYVPLKLLTYILGIGLMRKILREIFFCMRKKVPAKFIEIAERGRNEVMNAGNRVGASRFTAYIFCMLFLYCISVNYFRTNDSYSNKEEIRGLKIHSVIGQGLDKYAEDISDGETFSTYAGGLEIINGTFQPSGIDYIIHVLGDRQREKYLDNFIEGHYQYATTLKNEYTPDEYWLLRVNWFFYRELYMHYKPTKETNYSVIWERTDKENRIDADVKVDWEYINDTTCRIDIEVPDCTEGVYVDLLIKYDTAWTEDRLRNGGIRKAVCVEDGGEQYNNYYIDGRQTNTCYHLKEKTEGFSIPVYAKDGKGYAYISSYPLSCTKIDKVDVVARSVIKMPEFPLHVTNYTLYDLQTADESVDQAGKLLKFDSTQYNMAMLEDIKLISVGNECAQVNDVWREGNYIFVLLESPLKRNKLIYPNLIKVQKMH